RPCRGGLPLQLPWGDGAGLGARGQGLGGRRGPVGGGGGWGWAWGGGRGRAGWGRCRTWPRAGGPWWRRREVFGRRQEHQLVRLGLLPGGRGRGGGRRRLRRGRRFFRFRLWSFGLNRLRLARRRLRFGLLGRRSKRSIGYRTVGPVVLPRDERALLAPRAERFFAQQLVKRQLRRGP